MSKIADKVHLLQQTYQEFPSVMPHSATQEEYFIQKKMHKECQNHYPFRILE